MGCVKRTPFFSAVVLVAVLVLVVITVVVLILIIILVLVLVIHYSFLRNNSLRLCRYRILSIFSGFILSFEENTCGKTGKDSCCNPGGTSFQSSGKYTNEAIFLHRLTDTFGQVVTKTS